MDLLKRTLSPHRLNHSKSVAKLAYQIAKKNKLNNPLRAYIAGLFHDLGKDIDKDVEKEIMKKHFPEFLDFPKFAAHQFTGSILVQEMFGVDDEEVIEAIRFHSTGNENMSNLAKIIYASDKIEPTRGFDSSDLILAMMDGVESGFKTVLQANKDFLLSQHKTINNSFIPCCWFDFGG